MKIDRESVPSSSRFTSSSKLEHNSISEIFMKTCHPHNAYHQRNEILSSSHLDQSIQIGNQLKTHNKVAS